MNKIRLGLILASVCFSSPVGMVCAQDFDSDPVVYIQDRKEHVKFTIGARMMSDVAYYNTEQTAMRSGAAITDARIRTSMTYDNWYFYADFDFAGGKFSQKDIYLKYTMEGQRGTHSFKSGYYNNPASMANNTSRGGLHFISRASVVNALSPGRQLGFSYRFYNKRFFANQGAFAENEYNDQPAGFQGLSIGGRWLYRPVNDEQNTLHVGLTFHYSHPMTGEEVLPGLLRTDVTLASKMQTYVDGTKQFLQAKIPWVDISYDLGAEFLYKRSDFFVRGEYVYKVLTKERDDEKLFEADLDGTWPTLEAWKKGNPLGTNHFHGGYLELGYKILGDNYKYSDEDAVLKGLSGKTLEIVGRYDYVDLNDIKDSDVYHPANDQYYAGGVVSPAITSTSIGGGSMHSATVGINYSFNKFVKTLVSYTYGRLDRDKFPVDQNFHTAQARLIFQF